MDLDWTKSLIFGMPDELERLKHAGYFDEFESRSRYHLQREDLPEYVKRRIELQLSQIKTLKKAYIIDEEDLISDITSYLPGFGEDDFEKIKGDTDWIFVDGKKKYVNFSIRALFLTSPLLRDWPGSTYAYPSSKEIEDICSIIMRDGKASISSDVRLYSHVNSAGSAGEELHVHLPFANSKGYGMKKVEAVEEGEKPYFSDKSHNQATVFFSRKCKGSEEEFSVRFRCVTETDYMSYEKLEELNKTGKTSEVYENRDLEEKTPCVVFTPFIRDLSSKIVGGETDKLKIAKKIYDYITTQYEYAYACDYVALDSLGEYLALRGRGDCGLQTCLYITLCRYNGIPARWQSGIVLNGASGVHDWCEIYIENVGFRPVDCAYGGERRFFGSEELREFYFGNMDPYRVVFNTDILCEFDPPKKHYRYDPYDNQYGEAETKHAQVPEECVQMGREILNLRLIK